MVTPAQRWRKHDFRKSLHFSKDHFRVINRIHEQFARMFANHLSGRLRTAIQMKVESIEEMPYEDFSPSVPTPTVVQLMDVSPLKGQILFNFDITAVFTMLDYFMGGVGKSSYPLRELTEIEEKLFHTIIGEIRTIFAACWNPFVTFEPEFVRVESNLQFSQIASPSESVLVIAFSLKIGEISAPVALAIPYITVERVVPQFTKAMYFNQTKAVQMDTHKDGQVTEHLKNTVIPVSAWLGETTLTVKDVLSLNVNDIVVLAQPIKQPICLYTNETPLLKGHVGTNRGRYAVKIVDEWKEGTQK